MHPESYLNTADIYIEWATVIAIIYIKNYFSLLCITKPERGSILTPTESCTVSHSIVLHCTSLTQVNNKYFVS